MIKHVRVAGAFSSAGSGIAMLQLPVGAKLRMVAARNSSLSGRWCTLTLCHSDQVNVSSGSIQANTTISEGYVPLSKISDQGSFGSWNRWDGYLELSDDLRTVVAHYQDAESGDTVYLEVLYE